NALEIEFESHVLWIEDFGESSGQNLEGQAAGLAAGDPQKRVTLRRVRPLVEEQADGAVALVDRLGPVRGKSQRQAVQADVAVTSPVDSPGSKAIAEPLRGRRGELTRTAVVAIAALEIIGFEGPFDFFFIAHSWLFFSRVLRYDCL